MSLVSITDSQAAKKGEFVAVCLKVGDLKSGTSSGRDWTRRQVTVQDASATTDLTLWGEDVNAMQVGAKYKCKGFWKEYNGRPQWSKGKYGSIIPVSGVGEVAQEAPPAPPAPPATPPPAQSTAQSTQQSAPSNPPQTPPPAPVPAPTAIPADMDEAEVKAVMLAARKIKTVEGIITTELKAGNPKLEIPPAKVGLYLKLLIDMGVLK